jgi:hypothetical protein
VRWLPEYAISGAFPIPEECEWKVERARGAAFRHARELNCDTFPTINQKSFGSKRLLPMALGVVDYLSLEC